MIFWNLSIVKNAKLWVQVFRVDIKHTRKKAGGERKKNRSETSTAISGRVIETMQVWARHKTHRIRVNSFLFIFFFSIPFCMCCSLSFSLAACFCVVSNEKKIIDIYIYIASLRKREKRSSNRNSSIYVLSITHSETISTENINHNGNYRFVKIRFVHFVCVVFGVCFDN